MSAEPASPRRYDDASDDEDGRSARRRRDDDGDDLENVIPEAAEVGAAAAEGEGAKKDEEKKKVRVIRNPQPKLDPDRITGSERGIGTLSQIFADFKHKGESRVKVEVSAKACFLFNLYAYSSYVDLS